jgi:DNA-binding Lrp family transcriptional regulator
MDELDLKLLAMLTQNPRRSFRDLADQLKISTPAVHRRVQAAMELGYITEPYATISPRHLNAVSVTVFGRSRAGKMEEVVKELGRNDSVYTVNFTSGMFVFVWGLLRSVNELGRFTSFVKKAAQMPEPEIGILTGDDDGEEREREQPQLTRLDIKIIRALRGDVRKSINDIAAEVRVSPKTVRRRLAKMSEDETVEIGMYLNQAASGDIAAFLLIRVDDDADKKKVGISVVGNHTPPMMGVLHLSNHTNLFMGTAWFHKMLQLHELIAALEAEKGVRSITPNILVKTYTYETWCDRLLDDPDKALAVLKGRQ